MRPAAAITVLLIFLFATGCSESRVSGWACPVKPPSPSALFDAQPGFPVASQFAFRSIWPSAASFQPVQELVEYRERFIDRQGDGFWNRGRDYVHRRFDTRRTGWGHR